MKKILKQIDLFLLDLANEKKLLLVMLLCNVIAATLNDFFIHNAFVSSAINFILTLFLLARGRSRHTRKRWRSYVYWAGFLVYAPYFAYIAVIQNPGIYGQVSNLGFYTAILADWTGNDDDSMKRRRRKLRAELEEDSVRTRTAQNLI